MKKPAKAWKPIPVAVQVKRHHKAVVAARKAAAHPSHPSKAATAKRSAAAKKAAAMRAKHRKWTPDGDVALCSARAVAMLTGQDPLELYWMIADDPDEGTTIEDALEAAGVPAELLDVAWPGLIAAGTGTPSPLILGLELPDGEPHAVVAHQGAWWSWGQPYQPSAFPGAVIDEAWAVTWQ